MKYAVVTTVTVKEGPVDVVGQLFSDTNPALVADQPHWHGAQMLVDGERREVTVVARCDAPSGYTTLRDSVAFQMVRGRVSLHLEGRPETTITEVLVDM